MLLFLGCFYKICALTFHAFLIAVCFALYVLLFSNVTSIYTEVFIQNVLKTYKTLRYFFKSTTI